MKRERIIRIKNPLLRNLRSNLRKVLLLARSEDLTEKKSKIEEIRIDSICQCSNLGACPNIRIPIELFYPTDLDMGYIPWLKKGYCADCFSWIAENEHWLKKAMNPSYVLSRP